MPSCTYSPLWTRSVQSNEYAGQVSFVAHTHLVSVKVSGRRQVRPTSIPQPAMSACGPSRCLRLAPARRLCGVTILGSIVLSSSCLRQSIRWAIDTVSCQSNFVAACLKGRKDRLTTLGT